jgi:hypothetical protein
LLPTPAGVILTNVSTTKDVLTLLSLTLRGCSAVSTEAASSGAASTLVFSAVKNFKSVLKQHEEITEVMGDRSDRDAVRAVLADITLTTLGVLQAPPQSERTIVSKRDEPDTASSVDIPVGMTVLGFKISALRAAA